MNDVTIFGMGYVGTVLAVGYARHGFRVGAVETSVAKRALFAAGRIPFAEPRLPEEFARHRAKITIGGSLAEAGLAPVAMISVGTPRDPQTGACDGRAVLACLREIAAHVRSHPGDHLVLMRSTLWPGLWEECVRAAGPGVRLGAHPEFMREGSSLDDFESPALHVLGVDDPRDVERVAKLYPALPPPARVPPKAALLLKYASNAFHAVKVDFANELAACAAAFGVDGREILELFARDTRLNVSAKYLRPGLPFGGSCLPKDVSQIEAWARGSGTPLPLLQSLLASNAATAERIAAEIAGAGHRKVAVVGLTFKAGTDDLRGSAAVEIARLLAARGVDVVGVDPALRPEAMVDLNRRLYDELAALRGFALRPALDGTEQAVYVSFDSPETRAVVANVPPGVPVVRFHA